MTEISLYNMPAVLKLKHVKSLYIVSVEKAQCKELLIIHSLKKKKGKKRKHHFDSDQYWQCLRVQTYSATASLKFLENSFQRACKTQDILH